MTKLNVAVVGTGIIGRTHIETLERCSGIELCALVDPLPVAAKLAARHQVAFFQSIETLLDAGIADAVIISSPNDTHVPIATACLMVGVPVLLEKPVASSAREAEKLAEVVAHTGVPVLVGHHRRHNPITKTAKTAISNGVIGDLVTANVNVTLSKPEPYFDVAWRVEPSQGGPLMINLIHEVDLLRHFFGGVARVQAVTSNSVRGLQVEDTAAAILSFTNGGIASLTITDAGCGPWAWDVSAAENISRFPAHDVFAHAYSGSKAALSLPDLTLWQHPGTPDWADKMQSTKLPYEPADSYRAQLEHFALVATGQVTPLVSCADGIENMRVIAAIKQSANEGRAVDVSAILS